MKTRIVLDANIIVSALIKPSSTPGSVLKFILDLPRFELVISDNILEELKRVIFYPKARKYINKSDEELHLWLDALVVQAFIANIRFSHPRIVEEDPDDDKYIVAALESGANFLISGDKHLLNLKTYQHVNIVSAKQFSDLIIQKHVHV